MMHTHLFVYEFKNSRLAHSRTIQIIEIKLNMQKTYDGIIAKIAKMTKHEKIELQRKLSK